MRNYFDLTVLFKENPTMPYEWNGDVQIIRAKVERISTDVFKRIATYHGSVLNRKGTLVLSDTKNAIALRLKSDGQIASRSFLEFKDSLDVCEFAHNLKETHIDFKESNRKVEYSRVLSIEKEMKDYIKNSISDSKNEDFKKYLYFLYRGEIDGYSEYALLRDVEDASLDDNLKLYKFIIEG